MNNKIFIRAYRYLILIMVSSLFVGCGVRGKPLPPLTPAEIGTGRPGIVRQLPKSNLMVPVKDSSNEAVGDEEAKLQGKKRK